MATFNQATVIGFVGDAPRIIQTQSNTAMASFAIATTERGYQRQDGTQVEDRTEWHNIVFFGKPAEVIGRYVHKGSSLFVQGKMRTRSYEDNNGIKRYVTEIIGENFQLLDKKTNTSDAQPNNSVSSASKNNGNGYQAPQNDDLPF